MSKTFLKDDIRKAQSFQEIADILNNIDMFSLSSLEIQFVCRRFGELKVNNELRVAYLGNFTLEPLDKFVKVFAARDGLITTEYIGAYDQYVFEVMDEKSMLNKFNPHVILLFLSLKKLLPEAFYSFGSLSNERRRDCISEITSIVSVWAEHARKNTQATVLLSNFVRPDYLHAGIFDLKQNFGETEFYACLNLEFMKTFRDDPRIFLVDTEKLAARYGKRHVSDNRLYYLAKKEWNDKFMPFLAEEIVRFFKAMQNLTRKCLVLDLDNTLWGGIVGEDGPLGVKVGQDDPEGEAYYDFQRKIRSLKDRGILLGICSKNNFDDVKEVFDQREDMPLKFSDFSAKEINWSNKHENLIKIAQALNIGTDSIVFVDDNPAECQLVKKMLPEVKTIHLSDDPSSFVGIIDSLSDFEKILITHEDSKKSLQYEQNVRRHERMREIGDIRSYLESLDTKIVIRKAQIEDLPRVHQLFTKTNQFNVTTIRYSMGEVEKFFREKQFDLSVVEARDQFGVFGTIGLFLIEIESHRKLRIDSIILSCRAMGRGIEIAIMNFIKDVYLSCSTEQNTCIEGLYLLTKKNKPVECYFDEQGFVCDGKMQNGSKKYYLYKKNNKQVDCGWIRVLSKEEYDGREN